MPSDWHLGQPVFCGMLGIRSCQSRKPRLCPEQADLNKEADDVEEMLRQSRLKAEAYSRELAAWEVGLALQDRRA